MCMLFVDLFLHILIIRNLLEILWQQPAGGITLVNSNNNQLFSICLNV